MVEQRPVSAGTRDAKAGIEMDELSKAIAREKLEVEERRNRFT